ncbi:MAG TPA: amidohydrolase family protein [Candidatus Binataceae bacterium]
MGANRDREFLTRLMDLSGRPLQWGLVMQLESNPGMHREQLAWLSEMHRRGYPMYAQSMAVDVSQKFTMEDYNLFDTNPHWLEATLGTVEERLHKLGDPSRRAGLKEDMDRTHRGVPEAWDAAKVLEVTRERNYRFEGRSVGDIARSEGRHPVDVFLDLCVDEGLKCRFAWHDLHIASGEIVAHPGTHVSLGDGGAHTRYQTSSAWPTHFLSHWIRDRQLMSVEDAHYKIAALPAWIAGFRDRGILREGMAADVIVYDLEKLAMDEPRYAADFPGGARRLIQKAKGFRYTIVNGVITFEEDRCTGALPGKLLRSYDMIA